MIMEKRDHPSAEAEEHRNLIVRVLAGVLVRVIDREIPSLRLAMGDEAFERMLFAFFPRVDPTGFMTIPEFLTPVFRADEYIEVYGLLLDHRSVLSEEADWMAASVSLACQGQNHLWQDLGLDDRGMLSRVLGTFFRPLADLNVKDMKWKKFLYKRLCEIDGLKCRAPSCSLCKDYNGCYGPEV